MNYFDSGYYDTTTIGANMEGVGNHLIWVIVMLVLAVVGGIALYFTVFSHKNDGKYKGFMAKLYDFVHFKLFFIDDLFKILYLVSALAITLVSFSYIGSWKFLVYLIGGNIVLRLSYELMMLFVVLCHDVRNISNKKK